MTPKNDQKWGPKIDFFWTFPGSLKSGAKSTVFLAFLSGRTVRRSVGRTVDLHLCPHYFLQTHASRAINFIKKLYPCTM